MGRTYNNPPLIEAVCDFRFSSSLPWDWTIPGLFYEQIQDSFPNKNQLNVVETKIDANEGKLTQQSRPKIQFLNREETAVIQVSPDNLTIHQLRPYDGWENFKARILKYLKVYAETAHPENLAVTALRYVNRVDLPYSEIELEDYFNILPKVPYPIPQVFPTFLLNIEIPYSSLQSLLRVNFGTVVPEGEAKLSYLLDLSMFSSNATVAVTGEVSQWLEFAHKHIEEAFDAAFTDRTHHEVFKEVIQ